MTDKTDFFPKVLICAPQHDSKNYAFDRWLENIQNFTYPNYEIFLADNSATDENVKKLKAKGITAVHVPQHPDGLYFTMADSHNACRNYALENGYTWILHLETDVIPPIDVIERLLQTGKKCVSGLYDILFGESRRLMIQMPEPFDRTIRAYRTVQFVEEDEPTFFDGTIKQVYHAGLGCMLMHKDVFGKIPFRCEKGQNYHTDTFFANDCFQQKIPIFAHTAIQCQHLNQTWLINISDIRKNLLAK